MMSSRHGFTLIELLIVVLIIAILAAIAVPNFLEFQTRAKIARVKSDIRTLATAIEAYCVDEGRYPIGFWEGTQWQPVNFGLSEEGKILLNYSRLTTPIAYMSSIPDDPFIDKASQIRNSNNQDWGPGYRKYHYQSVSTHTGLGRDMGTAYERAAGAGVKWVLSSVGPSRRWTPEGWSGSRHVVWAPAQIPTQGNEMGYPELVYDPTNGTHSFGYVITSNKGMM